MILYCNLCEADECGVYSLRKQCKTSHKSNSNACVRDMTWAGARLSVALLIDPAAGLQAVTGARTRSCGAAALQEQ
jgi:hypothetical protein